MRTFFSPDYLLFLGDKIVKLVAIIILVVIVCRIAGILIDRFFLHEQMGVQKFLAEKRARTLSAILKLVVRYAVYFIASVMVLREFNIDTTSILAGAGIIGLAVGVGAQGLVRDVVTGFFIILEDQYAVGDYIVSGNMEGTVEELGFRITKLRDANGVLHIIPNGAITRVSNHTRGNTQAIINIPVAYQADIKKVMTILERVCKEMVDSMPELLAEPKIIGIVDFKQGEVIVRVVATTIALQQEKIETDFRYRAKLLFEEAQIPASAVALAVSTEQAEGKS